MIQIDQHYHSRFHCQPRKRNKANPDKKIDISLKKEKDKVSFTIKDEGTGFDPKDLPDPTAPENLENPGGRGVFLMRHLADEINFENEGRRVEMIFNI